MPRFVDSILSRPSYSYRDSAGNPGLDDHHRPRPRVTTGPKPAAPRYCPSGPSVTHAVVRPVYVSSLASGDAAASAPRPTWGLVAPSPKPSRSRVGHAPSSMAGTGMHEYIGPAPPSHCPARHSMTAAWAEQQRQSAALATPASPSPLQLPRVSRERLAADGPVHRGRTSSLHAPSVRSNEASTVAASIPHSVRAPSPAPSTHQDGWDDFLATASGSSIAQLWERPRPTASVGLPPKVPSVRKSALSWSLPPPTRPNSSRVVGGPRDAAARRRLHLARLKEELDSENRAEVEAQAFKSAHMRHRSAGCPHSLQQVGNDVVGALLPPVPPPAQHVEQPMRRQFESQPQPALLPPLNVNRHQTQTPDLLHTEQSPANSLPYESSPESSPPATPLNRPKTLEQALSAAKPSTTQPNTFEVNAPSEIQEAPAQRATEAHKTSRKSRILRGDRSRARPTHAHHPARPSPQAQELHETVGQASSSSDRHQEPSADLLSFPQSSAVASEAVLLDTLRTAEQKCMQLVRPGVSSAPSACVPVRLDQSTSTPTVVIVPPQGPASSVTQSADVEPVVSADPIGTASSDTLQPPKTCEPHTVVRDNFSGPVTLRNTAGSVKQQGDGSIPMVHSSSRELMEAPQQQRGFSSSCEFLDAPEQHQGFSSSSEFLDAPELPHVFSRSSEFLDAPEQNRSSSSVNEFLDASEERRDVVAESRPPNSDSLGSAEHDVPLLEPLGPRSASSRSLTGPKLLSVTPADPLSALASSLGARTRRSKPLSEGSVLERGRYDALKLMSPGSYEGDSSTRRVFEHSDLLGFQGDKSRDTIHSTEAAPNLPRSESGKSSSAGSVNDYQGGSLLSFMGRGKRGASKPQPSGADTPVVKAPPLLPPVQSGPPLETTLPPVEGFSPLLEDHSDTVPDLRQIRGSNELALAPTSSSDSAALSDVLPTDVCQAMLDPSEVSRSAGVTCTLESGSGVSSPVKTGFSPLESQAIPHLPSLGSREVLVALKAIAIDNVDRSLLRKQGRSSSLLAGRGFSGHVASTGSDVQDVEHGDMVFGITDPGEKVRFFDSCDLQRVLF